MQPLGPEALDAHDPSVPRAPARSARPSLHYHHDRRDHHDHHDQPTTTYIPLPLLYRPPLWPPPGLSVRSPLPPPETLVWAPAGRHTQKRKPGPGVWRGAAAGRWPVVLSVGADWGRDRGELSWRSAVVIGVVCRCRCGGKVKPFQTRASGMRALSSLLPLPSPLSPPPLSPITSRDTHPLRYPQLWPR